MRCHKPWAPDCGAERNEAAFGLRCVASPHAGAERGDAVVYPGFSEEIFLVFPQKTTIPSICFKGFDAFSWLFVQKTIIPSVFSSESVMSGRF